MATDICAAPRQQVEKELVVAARRQADRLPALDCGRLTLQLGGVPTFLDHDSSPEAGANVVTPAVLERGEHLPGRAHGEDPGMFGLGRFNPCEAVVREYLGEGGLSFGLDSQLRDPCGASPLNERVDGRGGRGNRPAGYICLAHRSNAPK